MAHGDTGRCSGSGSRTERGSTKEEHISISGSDATSARLHSSMNHLTFFLRLQSKDGVFLVQSAAAGAV